MTPTEATMVQDPDRPQLVLASASPRRQEILTQLGIPFEVRVSDVDEESLHRSTPRATALAIALAKAQAVMDLYPQGTLVLAADTVVALDQELLLKPPTAEAAVAMLSRLSGRTHQVITAVALGSVGGAVDLRASRAEVTFRDLSQAEMEAYAATGDPLDKAGGYGIQNGGGQFIARLEGDYYGVMGLPASLVVDMVGEYPFASNARLRLRSLPIPQFPLHAGQSPTP